ncbi:Lon protease C-terminal proteolytic domain-containing protein [Paraphysoderma sedebokerense]|nr:Lon protease C-terminal proteolytic domain-containing protein [Paraphysoderma sedebokerense]
MLREDQSGIPPSSGSENGNGGNSSNSGDNSGSGSGKGGRKGRIRRDEEKNDENVKRKDESETAVEGDRAEANGATTSTSDTKSSPSSSGSSGERAVTQFQRSETLQRLNIPEKYSPLLALPITRRPLFPGFYKTVVIKDPEVIAAIKDITKNQQPYVGAFLLKDEEADTDVVKNIDDIYKVGTFAQITNIYHSGSGPDDTQTLTAILYPHRRIRIKELIPPSKTADRIPVIEPAAEPVEIGQTAEKNADSKLSQKAPTAKDASPQSYLSSKYGVSLVTTEPVYDEPYSRKNQLIRAVTSELVNVFKDIATLNPLFREQIAAFSVSQSSTSIFDDPAKLADFAAAVSGGSDSAELQSILESLVIEERLQKSLYVLKKELVNAQLQSKISKEVESKIAKRQREYYLMEQLKGIKKELGIESDGKDKLVEKFKEKAKQLKMPKAVSTVFDEELSKFQHLEPASSEFNVTRNYLDWLTAVPWGRQSAETLDVAHAQKVLDEDHYGLKDVKERIIEFIAVGKLRGTVEGEIICMVGPPGVGKTSIGKSIARSLNREFFRFSVGGLTDVAEIKGHRRTYVGAMPGKIVQALKKVQTENPLILIDEVDKIGRGHQGDPASALLELLDPEQNSSFLDHYMDVPIDLSKVLFVCTANVLETIPLPLLDRMEVITLSGYVANEKLAIASKYLVPQAKAASGLYPAKCDVDVILQNSAIDALNRQYCRESGVRNLKKHIDKVFRKAAFKVVKEFPDHIKTTNAEPPKTGPASTAAPSAAVAKNTASSSTDEGYKSADEKSKEKLPEEKKIDWTYPADSPKIEITSSNLKEYVGNPIFTTDRLYDKTPPGVVMGLAWTSMGGSALYVESVLESPLFYKSKPMFNRTGQLGDVMKESSTIAYTYAKSYMAQHLPENKFFEKAAIHLHVPEGATPKDGPSAGITMATALLSLALNTPIPTDVAMTGELTLTGKVLKIGGLKEKTIAAKRTGVNKIIFPKANLPEWEELEEYVKGGVEGIPVDWYDEVANVCFGGLQGNGDWKQWEKLYADDRKEKKKD